MTNCETDHPRPTVHSIWPCGSSVGRKTSLLLSSPNAERFIRMKCMFGLDNNNDVFLPTDEPHGQIECTVGRG